MTITPDYHVLNMLRARLEVASLKPAPDDDADLLRTIVMALLERELAFIQRAKA